MKHFLFKDNLGKDDFGGVSEARGRVVRISGVKDKASLLKMLADGLELPSYFGMNWDALSDCLKDLSWLSERRVVLRHDELPHVSEDDLRTYLEILKEVGDGWGDNGAHEFLAVFPSASEKRIVGLIG